MESVKPGRKNSVQKLVDATNRYKMFIELELIFDSPEDFLYRQKGQLKLNNTILEEFLPQLMFRGFAIQTLFLATAHWRPSLDCKA